MTAREGDPGLPETRSDAYGSSQTARKSVVSRDGRKAEGPDLATFLVFLILLMFALFTILISVYGI